MSIHRTHLADLDELAQQVRDQVSRGYVLEAIANFRVGSYRSAIVATWTAICYDIVAKSRELAAAQDAVAIAFIKRVDDAIRQPNNPKMFLDVERDLLDQAMRADFIGHRELQELDRIRSDRHMCAHPAFVTDAVLFQPSPDLVRSHIVHAIEHLLRHPPTEGKAAVSRFEKDLESASFPTSDASVEAFLRGRFRVKATTHRSLIIVALKASLIMDVEVVRDRALAALRSFSRMEHEIYIEAMRERLSRQADVLDDVLLPRLAPLIEQDHDLFAHLGVSNQGRLDALLTSSDMSLPHNRVLFRLIGHQAFLQSALQRVSTLSDADLYKALSEHPSSPLTDSAIALFSRAPGFRTAESYGETLLQYAPYLRAEHIERILSAASTNGQIWHAGGMQAILAQLLSQTLPLLTATKGAWLGFMASILSRPQVWPDPAEAYKSLRDELVSHGIAVPAVAAQEGTTA